MYLLQIVMSIFGRVHASGTPRIMHTEFHDSDDILLSFDQIPNMHPAKWVEKPVLHSSPPANAPRRLRKPTRWRHFMRCTDSAVSVVRIWPGRWPEPFVLGNIIAELTAAGFVREVFEENKPKTSGRTRAGRPDTS